MINGDWISSNFPNPGGKHALEGDSLSWQGLPDISGARDGKQLTGLNQHKSLKLRDRSWGKWRSRTSQQERTARAVWSFKTGRSCGVGMSGCFQACSRWIPGEVFAPAAVFCLHQTMPYSLGANLVSALQSEATTRLRGWVLALLLQPATQNVTERVQHQWMEANNWLTILVCPFLS